MTGGPGPELFTERLRLRRWRDADRDPFAAMNADPAVMEHFPACLSRAESDVLIDAIERGFDERGFGLWAVELPGVAPFIGFVGLAVPSFSVPFAPCVEVGWRIAAEWWGHGYAPEASASALRYGFEQIGLAEIVSFTTTANDRSQRVMVKLGMHRDPADDFDHPLTPGWHEQRHVLYRLTAEEWARRAEGGTGR